MFKSIGFIIMLWGISLFFDSSMGALDEAVTEAFHTLKASAVVAQQQLQP